MSDASAQHPMSFDWSFPYPSQRMPVMAENMVATSQPLAAEAGLEMLRNGGNAIDAAIAAASTLPVVEPTSNGLGSDAFALIWKDGKLLGLNASGRAPAALTPSYFSGQDRVPFNGWGPITVPGAVSAWVKLNKELGRLPLADVFAPAMRYAERGFPVSPQTAQGWGGVPRRWRDQPSIQHAFAPGGKTPRPGDWWRFPEQAETLAKIAATDGEAFYTGDLAEAMVRHSSENDGLMTMKDLAEHQADWVDPISMEYHGYRLHEIPPNGQGLAALLMLGIFKHLNVADLDVDCPDMLHMQIEAMKLAFRDAHRYIADPKWMDVDVDDLLNEDYLAGRAKLIDPKKATDFEHGEPKAGGTVLLCTADAEGMMVSYIQSNYTGFGSGVVIPGTGISMQNRGACFTLEEGHPNQAGGGKRPYHTIIPGFVTRGDEPIMAFGVMGGPMQPQGHAQVLIRMADYQQNPQAALDAPRWQVFDGMEVGIEPGFPDDVYESLEARGHRIRRARRRTVTYGGGQVIVRLDKGYCAGSDLRRDGLAIGF